MGLNYFENRVKQLKYIFVKPNRHKLSKFKQKAKSPSIENTLSFLCHDIGANIAISLEFALYNNLAYFYVLTKRTK